MDTKQQQKAKAREMIRLRENNPSEYKRMQARKSIRLWMRNLRAAKKGEGFFKVDHCEAMIALHLSRYRTPE